MSPPFSVRSLGCVPPSAAAERALRPPAATRTTRGAELELRRRDGRTEGTHGDRPGCVSAGVGTTAGTATIAASVSARSCWTLALLPLATPPAAAAACGARGRARSRHGPIPASTEGAPAAGTIMAPAAAAAARYALRPPACATERRGRGAHACLAAAGWAAATTSGPGSAAGAAARRPRRAPLPDMPRALSDLSDRGAASATPAARHATTPQCVGSRCVVEQRSRERRRTDSTVAGKRSPVAAPIRLAAAMAAAGGGEAKAAAAPGVRTGALARSRAACAARVRAPVRPQASARR